VKYNAKKFKKNFFTFFWNSPTGQTRQWILMHDGPKDEDSRKGVPFGDFIDIAAHSSQGQAAGYQLRPQAGG